MLRFLRLAVAPISTASAVLLSVLVPVSPGIQPLASSSPPRAPSVIVQELLAAPWATALAAEVDAVLADPGYARAVERVGEHVRRYDGEPQLVGPHGDTAPAALPADPAGAVAAVLRASLVELPTIGDPDTDAAIARLNALLRVPGYQQAVQLLLELVENPTVAQAMATRLREEVGDSRQASTGTAMTPIHHTPNDWVVFTLYWWDMSLRGIQWTLNTQVLPCQHDVSVIAGCLYGSGPWSGPAFRLIQNVLFFPQAVAFAVIDASVTTSVREAVAISFVECRSWFCYVDARATSPDPYSGKPWLVEARWSLTPAVGPSANYTTTGSWEELDRSRQDLQWVWRAWDFLQPGEMSTPYGQVCARYVTVTVTIRVYWGGPHWYFGDYWPGDSDHVPFDESTMVAPVCAVPAP